MTTQREREAVPLCLSIVIIVKEEGKKKKETLQYREREVYVFVPKKGKEEEGFWFLGGVHVVCFHGSVTLSLFLLPYKYPRAFSLKKVVYQKPLTERNSSVCWVECVSCWFLTRARAQHRVEMARKKTPSLHPGGRLEKPLVQQKEEGG
jgi:hypothetical protein